MRRSGCKRGRPAYSLLEVELAALCGAMLLIAFIGVDREVRRTLSALYHEVFLETVYRDLQADLARQLPAALSRATDGYDYASLPVRPDGNTLTLSDGAAPAFALRFAPPTPGVVALDGQLLYSPDGGANWQPMVAIGSHDTLAAVRFSYAGWGEEPSPPEGRFGLSDRVRYDLVGVKTTLQRADAVPYVQQAFWAPRSVDWRWRHHSRAGAPVPPPGQGIFYPLAFHRSALGDDPTQPFELFAVGPGKGNIGWLTWNGDASTPALEVNLAGPSSHGYTNPLDPYGTDHDLAIGSWIPSTPGHHQGIQAPLQALVGQEINVVAWEVSRGQGANTSVQAAAFARIRLVSAEVPTVTARFVGWVDDQGRLLPEQGALPSPPAPEPSVTPAPSAAPSPAPSTAASPAPLPLLPDRVVPIALNQPIALISGQPLGWLYAGADFAWLTWSGAKDDATLQRNLTLPGAASVDDLAVGRTVVGFSALTEPSLLTGQLDALLGVAVVAPLFDQVDGDRFRVSGFGLVRIDAYDATRLKLKVYYIGPCDAYGQLL